MADDIHVLGKILPPGGGSFEVMHPGRYRITPLDGSNLSGTYKESFAELLRPSTNTVIVAKLDGATVPGAPVELNVGPHRLETATNEQAAVFWVGPKRSELSRLEGGNHRWLFFNWY